MKMSENLKLTAAFFIYRVCEKDCTSIVSHHGAENEQLFSAP